MTLLVCLQHRHAISIALCNSHHEICNAVHPALGIALQHTVGKCLEDRFTPEVRDAWQTVYNVLADTAMKAAAPYYEMANREQGTQ
jgi:hemoglobin-like flavoprotein